MAQNVIRKHGIKGLVVEREILRNVALLEMRPLSETSCPRKLVRIANSGLHLDGGPQRRMLEKTTDSGDNLSPAETEQLHWFHFRSKSRTFL
jgi:hypothetical protein